MRYLARILLVALVIPCVACADSPRAIPTGSWNYALLINGVRAGSAVISNRKEGETYVITSELDMDIAGMRNVSRQVVTETTAFTPVKLETSNRIKSAAGWKDIQTTALFRGAEVELRSGGRSTRVTLPGEFVLDGNYFVTPQQVSRLTGGRCSIEKEAAVPLKAGLELSGNIAYSFAINDNADKYADDEGLRSMFYGGVALRASF